MILAALAWGFVLAFSAAAVIALAYLIQKPRP